MYITSYYILGQIGDLLHVVEILSMAFPRKKKNKLIDAFKQYKSTIIVKIFLIYFSLNGTEVSVFKGETLP